MARHSSHNHVNWIHNYYSLILVMSRDVILYIPLKYVYFVHLFICILYDAKTARIYIILYLLRISCSESCVFLVSISIYLERNNIHKTIELANITV